MTRKNRRSSHKKRRSLPKKRPESKPIRVTVKISENFKWIEKHIKRAKKHMPSLLLPRQIRSYRPPLNREMRVLGTCAVETRVITLCTHKIMTTYKSGRARRKHVPIPKKEILMTLAHEIAHLRYEFHNYEQESYARTIFQAFGIKEPCPHCAGTGQVVARYVN